MPPPHLTDMQRHFFSLYRRILRVHEKKLPFEMRVLGNLFVKEEFKKTLKAKPMYWPRFINEWEAYYDDLAKDLHVGKDLSEEDKEAMNDGQREQLVNLEKEAKHIFDKENKV
ncbi:uncharacterized protein [Blastocystis hominis]|uniref:Succinate dehydrogenase assembly factor 3 n=1 Tax=Blastocystis hominis TaxID=12968 RepID=D8LX86_BLAHO|nr:uncharacterized protein [Blastocystis hominis]CBK20881.2 unnamed protein product [Blastocystis hominis]|eukprot:XP_012894929.1 uncharacterized protein [Blastocystis hominis]